MRWIYLEKHDRHLSWWSSTSNGCQDRFEWIVRPIGLPGTNSSLNLPMLEFPVIICQPGVAQPAPRDLRALV